jgi:hypothetical protein
VALGFVSLFADMTYEGATSVIGPLLKDLGASATQVGIIAGLGEMIAASLRYFSGRLADPHPRVLDDYDARLFSQSGCRARVGLCGQLASCSLARHS